MEGLFKKMKKWNIGWGTIAACNMKCQFCYSKERRKQGTSLGLSDWITFIDKNHDKISTINYGTGENSISDDWFTLVQYIRRNYPSIKQAVTTNGYVSERIKDEKLYNIITEAVDEFDRSLDFCLAKQHSELRGQKNAFIWAINTLRYCNKENKESTIVFLGSKVNLDLENIKGLFQIAKEYNSKLRMNIYRPTEGIDEISQRFIPTYQDIVGALQYISEHYEILSLNDSFFSALLTNRGYIDPSGINSLRILANGDITPSTYLIHDQYIVGNIRNDKALDNIDCSIAKIVYDKIPSECKNCILKTQCKGGVIDRRYLWYNTLEKKDPYCMGPYYDESLLPKKVVLSSKKFHSVHDGYLPTMFFINK